MTNVLSIFRLLNYSFGKVCMLGLISDFLDQSAQGQETFMMHTCLNSAIMKNFLDVHLAMQPGPISQNSSKLL